MLFSTSVYTLPSHHRLNVTSVLELEFPFLKPECCTQLGDTGLRQHKETRGWHSVPAGRHWQCNTTGAHLLLTLPKVLELYFTNLHSLLASFYLVHPDPGAQAGRRVDRYSGWPSGGATPTSTPLNCSLTEGVKGGKSRINLCHWLCKREARNHFGSEQRSSAGYPAPLHSRCPLVQGSLGGPSFVQSSRFRAASELSFLC